MASILDALTGAVFFIVFAFALFISFMVFNSLVNSGGIFTTYAPQLRGFYTSMNNVAIFIVLGMSMGAIGAALLIKAHPIFFGVAVILIFVEFMIVPPLVVAFNQIASNPSYGTEAGGLNLMVALVQYLPVFTAIFSALAAIVGIMRN